MPVILLFPNCYVVLIFLRAGNPFDAAQRLLAERGHGLVNKRQFFRCCVEGGGGEVIMNGVTYIFFSCLI
jgi:hypothetical protein